MNTAMIEKAGTQMLSTAASFGRMQTETLEHLANATKSTPLAPFFALHAQVSRFATENMERMIEGGAPSFAPAPAAKPAPAKAAPVTAPAPVRTPEAAAPVVEPEIGEVIFEAETETEVAAEPDDLSMINGIGPATAAKLADAGIATFADLAKREAEELTDLLEGRGVRMTRFSPAQWIAEARTYAG